MGAGSRRRTGSSSRRPCASSTATSAPTSGRRRTTVRADGSVVTTRSESAPSISVLLTARDAQLPGRRPLTGPQAHSVLRLKRDRPSGWAAARLRSDELLIGSFAGSLRRRELDRVPRWRGDHVTVKQVVDDFARYLYPPRLQAPRGAAPRRCGRRGLRTRSGCGENPGNPAFVGEIGGLCGSERVRKRLAERETLAVRLAVESRAGLRMSSSRHFEAVTLDDLLFGYEHVRISVKWNTPSGDVEHGFRRSGTLVGAQRR